MQKMQEYYVYILASKRNGTMYVGMTGKLGKRAVRHKERIGSKFTGDYEVNKLVYFEVCKDKQTASEREKQLKKWNRRWKIRLIEKNNPKWKDLYTKICKTRINPGSSAEDQSS
jgi:putative endonuclease